MKEYKRRRPRLNQELKVYCLPTESAKNLDGSDCPLNCSMKDTPSCPLLMVVEWSEEKSKNPKPQYRAGGWSTHRGMNEGILVHASNPDDKEDKVSVWFDKQTATRFTHTVLEAQIRFWDILWNPDEVRDKVKELGWRIGMETTEPYREGCPLCTYVADTEEEMLRHLKDEHLLVQQVTTGQPLFQSIGETPP